MVPERLDMTTRAALLGAALLLFLAGAGWALTGDAVFLASVMAGIAGCF